MEDKGSKAIRIGKLLLNDDELKIRLQYNGEMFTLRYPNPAEKAMIEAEIARSLGGLPRSSYSDDHLTMVEAVSYVHRLMIPEECPEWFKNAWTCMDERLIGLLYSEYLQFRDKFRKRLEDDGLQGNSKT